MEILLFVLFFFIHENMMQCLKGGGEITFVFTSVYLMLWHLNHVTENSFI